MPNNPSVLVCVTGQKTCDRLIHSGLLIANEKNAPLFVLHVAKKDAPLLGASSDSEALNHLYGLAAQAGAEMTVLRAQDAQAAIADYVKKVKAQDVVLGASQDDAPGRGLALRLQTLLADVRFHIT